MDRPVTAAWERRLFPWLVALLAVTGFGQMPIFKRYYIADVPGLGWTADYWLTHRMHYALAAVLLFILARWATRWLVRGPRRPLTGLGLALVLGTGVMRVLKNLPGISFDPTVTMLIDWTHLAMVMAWGLLALAAVAAKVPYLRAGN